MLTAILSACNSALLEKEHFDGNCIQKGFTRYYMSNGSYIDREDKEYGEHSYGEGILISERTCTQDEVTKYVCELCKKERFETVEKYGHDYKNILTQNPTCTDDGHADFECTRCHDTYTDVLTKLGHDYEETITKQPTCTENGSKDLHCKRCGYDTTAEIEKLNHDYEETVIEQASCTEKGIKSLVCRNCGDAKTEEYLLPHTPDGEAEFDGENHWHVCAVCHNVYGTEEHVLNSKNVAATCVDHAYTRLECQNCKYSRIAVDETSPYAAHSYEAYTCKVCQRDNMLDFKSEFDSKGGSADNLISITSENMFVCFYDYILAYQITDRKYIKLTYKTLYESEVSDYITGIRRKTTATNWNVETHHSYSIATKIVDYLYINAANSGNFIYSQVATYTPTQYDADTYDQFASYQFDYGNGSRPSSFDDFAYMTRRNTMNVTSSDQLFFAFEHGYKPVATSGSPAERMLIKAKTVARRIIDDSMDDTAKLRAIYSYLVREIAYDYGIVALTSQTNGDKVAFAKCSSYYLEGIFDYNIAVCDGISKAFCVLAGLEDIKCVRVTSTNHAWNKVYIDVNGDGSKAWYGIDATWGNQALKYSETAMGEYLTIEDFLFTDDQKTNRNQQGLNYVDSNSNATIEENPFKYFYFGESEDSSCDYVIESESELDSMVAYLKDGYGTYPSGDRFTVQFFITYSYLNKSDATKTISEKLGRHFIFMQISAAFVVDERDIVYGGVRGYSVSIIFSK